MKESLLEIVDGCKVGKRNSQHELFKIYYEKVKMVCLKYSNDINQAEDYLQDAFMKIFSNIHKCNYENENSFEAWIKRTTKNNILDYIKKNKKIYFQDNEDFLNYRDFENSENSNEDIYFLESQIGLTEGEIIKEIEKLPTAQKNVFNLFVIENLSHKEISKILEINEGTSKSNLSKAKNNLKKNLNKYINI
jgi:RNA polymerase sigma-70 factor (ECF subfamily)